MSKREATVAVGMLAETSAELDAGALGSGLLSRISGSCQSRGGVEIVTAV